MIISKTFDEKYPEGEKAKTEESLVWCDVRCPCQICGTWTNWRNADFGTYLCCEQCYADDILLERLVKAGYVYFIMAEDGSFKIGRSSNPKQRIANMRTATARAVDLVKTIFTGDMQGLELLLHHVFSEAPHRRIRGEWFHLEPDTAEYQLWMGAASRLEAWEVQLLLVRMGLRDIENFGIG